MKNISPRRMKLGFNIVANGAHVAGWRMPGAEANAAMDIRLDRLRNRLAVSEAVAERATHHFARAGRRYAEPGRPEAAGA